MAKKEKFLVFLKPDAYLRKYIGAKLLKKIYEHKDFQILAFKELSLSDEHAKKHYQEHEGKSFFPWLLKFIKIGPILAMIIEGDIQNFRELIGSTKCQEAETNSFRGEFGIWGGVNLIHASDSSETAKKELEIWEKKMKLTPGEDITKNIEAYISKWSIREKDFTKDLRTYCSELINTPNREEEIKSKLNELLKEECYDSDEEKIKLLTESIIGACKL